MILWFSAVFAVVVYVSMLYRVRCAVRAEFERDRIESEYDEFVREMLVEYEAVHADG